MRESRKLPPEIELVLRQQGIDPEDVEEKGSFAGPGTAIGALLGGTASAGRDIHPHFRRYPLDFYKAAPSKSALLKFLAKEALPGALLGGGLGMALGHAIKKYGMKDEE